MKKLYIDFSPYFARTALVNDGELIEFGVEHAARRGHVGNIYKGKVENVLGGMKAAFVNIGLQRNGFLYIGDRADKISPGDIVMCQVAKEEWSAKGARLTMDVTLPGYNLVLLPNGGFRGVSRKIEDEQARDELEKFVSSICPPNMGFIVRSAAVKAPFEEIAEEAKELVELWSKIEADYAKARPTTTVYREAQLIERVLRDSFAEDVDGVVVNDPTLAVKLAEKYGSGVECYTGARNIFKEFGISEQIDKLADRKVQMEGGAYLVIDRTEALTVIDVNTGRYVGSKDLEDTVFRTNLVAAREVAKQLRVRNISGIVIIDFIDMQLDEHRRAVLDALREELKKDRLKTSAVAMTGLGLVELTRKRTRLPADTFMLEPCSECGGGYVVSSTHLALKLRDELVEFTLRNDFSSVIARAHPDVVGRIFSGRIMAREVLGLLRGKRVYFVADYSLARDKFEIEGTNDKVLTLPQSARLLY